MSYRYSMREFLFCHNVRPSCSGLSYFLVVLARYARLNTLDTGALCWCSFGIWGCCMGRKIEVQETVNEIFNICQAIFAPPSKWRPWHLPCQPYTLDTPLPLSQRFTELFRWLPASSLFEKENNNESARVKDQVVAALRARPHTTRPKGS